MQIIYALAPKRSLCYNLQSLRALLPEILLDTALPFLLKSHRSDFPYSPKAVSGTSVAQHLRIHTSRRLLASVYNHLLHFGIQVIDAHISPVHLRTRSFLPHRAHSICMMQISEQWWSDVVSHLCSLIHYNLRIQTVKNS